ncbi:hypothetical protein CNR22_18945 [Sphingobacteriaceae bacterium]|nr:hypothetical protein CNR22_18945 [Sphingobacteriaceae bacterium]
MTDPQLYTTSHTAIDQHHSRLNRPRIMIIDDSSANVKIIASLLSKEGYEVLTALDARKGVLITESKLPDLILLDVMMPDMNGFEVCSLLKSKKKTREIPIIFISALSETESLLKGLELGAVDYIRKPFNPPEVLARVKNHLKTHTSSGQLGALFESRYHSFITLNKQLEIVAFNEIANEREFLFNQKLYRIGDSILHYIPLANRLSFETKVKSVFTGKTLSFERKYDADNKHYWFQYLLEPIQNKQGSIVGCLVNGTDITEKKEYAIRANDYHKKLKDIYTETQESLSYASYIQKSIYPQQAILNKQFPDHFILFNSKEKVSGDFYWSHRSGNKDILVLGDCTGHGVPGALLTTISIVLLERLVKDNKITSPEKILSQMDVLVAETLKQKNGGMHVGLEMAICVFDRKSGTLNYAGAKRSLLMAHGDDIFEVKASRHDIGDGNANKTFQKHLIHPVQGSCVYLLSDGITDQIGGSKQKKFMKKNLEKIILSANAKPMIEQKTIFQNAISEWKGNGEQTDDMLLIGVKIK